MDQADAVVTSIPRQEDFDAIWQTALDNVNGWYSGDAGRMARALHPDLVKRTIERDGATGKIQLRRPTTADMMIAFTEEGGGSDLPEPERLYQLTIVDIFRHIALVNCVSPHFVDYLQLAKFDDQGWLIVNVLWEMRQGEIDSDS